MFKSALTHTHGRCVFAEVPVESDLRVPARLAFFILLCGSFLFLSHLHVPHAGQHLFHFMSNINSLATPVRELQILRRTHGSALRISKLHFNHYGN